jgi:acyl-CoA dehydrogenase
VTESSSRAETIAAKVKNFIREEIIPRERDPRIHAHGPTDEFVAELRGLARAAGVLTPHVLPDGSHLSHRETAIVLQAAGYSLLGMVAVNVSAPDEGNMYLLHKVATPAQQTRFLKPLTDGARSAFFMTEPAALQGAGSDPSMLITTAHQDGDDWVINGEKAFITGAAGASTGIIMAKTGDAATMFLVDLPHPGVKLIKQLDTLDGIMPGGHWLLKLENVRVPGSQVLGAVGEGMKYAQVRLAPARLTHCARWLGACQRAHEEAVAYTVHREAFGKKLIDHEGVGFQLADNMIELKQCELMIDWVAGVLDSGSLATTESSMAKVSVADALFRIADRCIQVMGGTGITADSMAQRVFREVRAFRVYDGPTEVHKWALAKKIKRDALKRENP